jgi:alkylation response protein AidB-like acyl-CoA dehydrogenase
MQNQYIDLRHIRFLLEEVFEIQQLQRYPYYADYDLEAIRMSVQAAKEISDQHLYPSYVAMDQQKAYYADGEVHVLPAVGEALRALGEGGWIAATDEYERGGGQMPISLLSAAQSIFYAANSNAASYAFLTQGAANLIRTFGADELQDTYIDKMYAGQWQGTMALTEPQAGSSLTDLTTSATPLPDGSYAIRGQKIYISGGDHNQAQNIVHLLLARIDGAPAGTKGVSLFVVPKYRLQGSELSPNDVTTAGIYGKMGQKGYVAAHLMLGEHDNCRGYLVGKPHRGLLYMFQMMNEARIGTGLFAAGNASMAYQASLQYAKERPQGRHPSNKDPQSPPVLIIEHADVKRMLLYQKAVVDGSLALLTQCSYYADLAKVETGKTQENAHLLLELLTPIAKSYPAEFGTLAVSHAMQVLGGAGYTDDFPIEQIYRDIRVNSIYEGTTTIHGMDLLGRKLLMHNGKAAALLNDEIQETIGQALAVPELRDFADELIRYGGQFQQVTGHLVQLASTQRPEVFLADATLYLYYTGYIVLAWQWLKQAIVAQAALTTGANGVEADFYHGKLNTCRYFYAYELPQTLGLRKRLLDEDQITLEMPSEQF